MLLFIFLYVYLANLDYKIRQEYMCSDEKCSVSVFKHTIDSLDLKIFL